MIRAVSWLVIGVLLGGGATWLVGNRGAGSVGAGMSSELPTGPGGPAAIGAEPIGVEERLFVYESAAAESDPEVLRAQLAAATVMPWSPARDVEIDALLARLSDLAPAYAAALARDLALDTRFLADVYVRWSGVDADAAIAGLAAIGSLPRRREVALALIEGLGDGSAGLQRVSVGLPGSEQAAIAIEWIALRAENVPYQAFRDAQALTGETLQRSALQRVGAVWAEQDPRSALAEADSLPEQLQGIFRFSVINEWARLDAGDVLSWLQQNPSPPPEAISAIRLLASSHPDLILGIADGMTGTARSAMRMQAMSALAEFDPDAAMARVSAMPPGSDRDSLLRSVASVLARRDADATLDWIQGLDSPASNVMNTVVFGILQADPDRAIDLMENPPAGIDPRLVASYIGSVAASEPGRSERLANRLLASDSQLAQNALQTLIGNWMQQDPEGAVEWVFDNDTVLGPAVIGPAANAMSMADPVGAAGLVYQIPDEYRSVWIAQVAPRYAAHDMNAALAWLEQFQGEEVYANAMRQAVSAAAQLDPRAAAEVLARSSPEVQLGAASQVATALARLDPRDAARWASSLQEPDVRGDALASAVFVWVQTDADAARAYTLGLERGAERDQALGTMLDRLSQNGNFDRDLLDAYSTDASRQEALQRVIPMLAQSDMGEARELLDLVTNAGRRSQVERMLDDLQR